MLHLRIAIKDYRGFNGGRETRYSRQRDISEVWRGSHLQIDHGAPGGCGCGPGEVGTQGRRGNSRDLDGEASQGPHDRWSSGPDRPPGGWRGQCKLLMRS